MMTLQAGPELDYMIADKVMGWITPDDDFPIGMFKPSTNIKDAWEVLEKAMLFRMYTSLVFDSKSKMYMFVYHRYDFGPAATTVSLAICLAALDAHLPDHIRSEMEELKILDRKLRNG